MVTIEYNSWMSNAELISNFIYLRCSRCDQREIVREGDKLIYSCADEAAEEYISTGTCFSAIVSGKEGIMTPDGFTPSEV